MNTADIVNAAYVVGLLAICSAGGVYLWRKLNRKAAAGAQNQTFTARVQRRTVLIPNHGYGDLEVFEVIDTGAGPAAISDHDDHGPNLLGDDGKISAGSRAGLPWFKFQGWAYEPLDADMARVAMAMFGSPSAVGERPSTELASSPLRVPSAHQP